MLTVDVKERLMFKINNQNCPVIGVDVKNYNPNWLIYYWGYTQNTFAKMATNFTPPPLRHAFFVVST